MIDPEQKELAAYVKHVHLSLRRKAREIGAKKAWEEHLKNEEILQKYASSMKKLAQDFWSANNQTFLCRIQWIFNYIINYYRGSLVKKEFEKEFVKMKMFFGKGLVTEEDVNFYKYYNLVVENKVKLLDVGSCYNPFGKFHDLEVYPIDLYPASPDVKKCNFIETRVGNAKDNWFCDSLIEIPENFFDVVVFCLFLEYLPSPEQRLVSCVKAYDCLRTNGLLLVVTPDSKHESANAGIMKKWKLAAARIGFVRTKLEKLKYLYCMAFRKAVCFKYPLLLYKIKKEDPEEMFVIPQDSVDYRAHDETGFSKRTGEDESETEKLFSQLPFL